MTGCSVCGGRFAEHKCGFCGRAACSSCMHVEMGKCIKCEGKKTVPWRRFVRQNLILIIFMSTIWIYTVYPWPFLYAFGFNVDMSAIQPIMIATIVLAIPFLFMLKAWKAKPPR